MKGPATLLVIGVHREELAFGEQVATGLDPDDVEVLRIGEGLSGRRPRPDERFRHEMLHRELYHQLLAHVRKGAYRLVIDLHTGVDRDGPCADIYCRAGTLRDCVEKAMRYADPVWSLRIRTIPIGPEAGEVPYAAGLMPERLWNNPAFGYVVLEVFLPEGRPAGDADREYARGLVGLVAGCTG